jgi:internalin A
VNLRFLDVSGTGITSISPVARMQQLVELVASGNQITQTEPLGALTQLTYVILVDNKVVDLGPLAQNEDIGAGDFVYVDRNELACGSQAINLQVLQARGVNVSSDCP